MQQREHGMLEKLAQAREAQSRAMQRFAQARARLLLVEARLQSLRERLSTQRLEAGEPGAAQQDASQTDQTTLNGSRKDEADTTAKIPAIRRSRKMQVPE